MVIQCFPQVINIIMNDRNTRLHILKFIGKLELLILPYWNIFNTAPFPKIQKHAHSNKSNQDCRMANSNRNAQPDITEKLGT